MKDLYLLAKNHSEKKKKVKQMKKMHVKNIIIFSFFNFFFLTNDFVYFFVFSFSLDLKLSKKIIIKTKKNKKNGK